MQIFVSIALKACEELGIADKKGQSMVMRFAKIYPPDKIVSIVKLAEKYPWSYKNPTAAFMKAVGEINKVDSRKVELPLATPKPKTPKNLKLL